MQIAFKTGTHRKQEIGNREIQVVDITLRRQTLTDLGIFGNDVLEVLDHIDEKQQSMVFDEESKGAQRAFDWVHQRLTGGHRKRKKVEVDDEAYEKDAA